MTEATKDIAQRDVEAIKAKMDMVCHIAVATLSVEDIQRVVQEIQRTETLMPIVDPTAFISVSDTLPDHLAAAHALLQFRLALEKLAPERKDDANNP